MGFMDSEAAKLFTHWYVVLLTFVPPFNFFLLHCLFAGECLDTLLLMPLGRKYKLYT